MKKILVLCPYNTARSQMAEGYLKFFAGGLVLVHSAGLKKKDLHPLAYRVMDEDNIDIKDQHPKLARQLLKNRYDFVITLSQDIPPKFLKQVRAKKHIQLHLEDPTQSQSDMEENFRHLREKIKKFVLKFIGQELVGSGVLLNPGDNPS